MITKARKPAPTISSLSRVKTARPKIRASMTEFKIRTNIKSCRSSIATINIRSEATSSNQSNKKVMQKVTSRVEKAKSQRRKSIAINKRKS